MIRTIEFRGKRCKDGEWVYGSYVESNKSWRGHKPHKSWILPSPMTNGGWFSIRGAYPVIEDTVGQFTGEIDIHGAYIYEGDIVAINTVAFDTETDVRIVEWSHKNVRFELRVVGENSYNTFNDVVSMVKVGNIFDDKQLLKGGDNA